MRCMSDPCDTAEDWPELADPVEWTWYDDFMDDV